MAEELDAIGSFFIFMTNAIWRRDKNSVCDRVRALRSSPGVDLRFSKFVFLRRMPADRCRIKKNFGAEERGNARSFGIPLIPADQHADLCKLRIPHTKSIRALVLALVRDVRITGSEIVLLVKKRIIRDVHLSIHA